LFDYHSFQDFWPKLSLIERRNGQMKLIAGPNHDNLSK
jgi:hypothetical protein